MPDPKFTEEQQEVINQIDENQADGVAHPVLSEGYDFSLQRLFHYLRKLLQEHRSALGHQIELMQAPNLPAEQMGMISPAMAAVIERSKATLDKISQSSSELSVAQQGINQQFSHQMQNVLGPERHNVLNDNPSVRDIQNQLLSGSKQELVIDNTLAEQANSTPTDLQLQKDSIAYHLQTQMDRRNRENPNRQLGARAMAVDQRVRNQIPAMAAALALSPQDIFDNDTKAGHVINDCLDNMHKKATQEYDATQNCLRTMPNDASQLSEVHMTQDLSSAQNTFQHINNTLEVLGVAPAPMPQPAPQITPTSAPRPS